RCRPSAGTNSKSSSPAARARRRHRRERQARQTAMPPVAPCGSPGRRGAVFLAAARGNLKSCLLPHSFTLAAQRDETSAGQLGLVFALHGFEKTGGSLLTTNHLLQFRRPACGEDSAGGIGDEVHGAIVL